MPPNYPALGRPDEKLLDDIFELLKRNISARAYDDENDAYARQIRTLPVGLHAMAATHHLDVSMSLDDMGWRFLNFGEPHFVEETERGSRELGVDAIAAWFAEAHVLFCPVRPLLSEDVEYFDALRQSGHEDRLNRLSRNYWEMEDASADEAFYKRAIYNAWIRHIRVYPEKAFPA